MTKVLLSLLGGVALSAVVVALLFAQVQVLVKRKRLNLWRGMASRTGILGLGLFLFLWHLKVHVATFVVALLVSYFVFVWISATLFFKEAKSHGRNA
ncbi:MAG: hypothetical protein ACUVTO_07520 [Candidatus Caldatribacteriaceae bacterium]